MKAVDRQMIAGVQDGVFPGGVLLVSKGRKVLFHRAYGVTNIFTGEAMKTDTVFDLASLTKPLATAVALMKLMARGALALDAPLATVLPEFANTEKRAITIAQLLAHHSGYPAYRPFYRTLRRHPAVTRPFFLRRMLVAQPLADMPGRRTIYSDLGYMILEWVVERVSGNPLDVFLDEAVYAPLSIDRLFFPSRAGSCGDASMAATEFCPWRNVLLSGRVHDDNADVVGGIAGHAGLFGTARGVHQLLHHVLSAFHGGGSSTVLRPDLVRRFCSPWGPAGRTPGFDRPEGAGSSAGRYFSENTVGHLGFTGTSFWMDLDRRVIVILLTNRVHPSRCNLTIRAFRPLLHDTVMEMVLQGESAGEKDAPKIDL
ncbi:serine hydrolase domain-containing protein [Desulfococcus sp.]|uniref:serine hydrolase domain-containing protein n=1 Tax=Desulfococcus sp. TaxID=2025834 RepID=UPI003593655D